MANDSLRSVSAAGAASASAAMAPALVSDAAPPKSARTLALKDTDAISRKPSVSQDATQAPPRGAAPSVFQGTTVVEVGHVDTAPAQPQPHKLRDVYLPVAGQLATWAGSSALISYGFARLGFLSNDGTGLDDVDFAKVAGGWAGGVIGLIGGFGVYVGASKQSKDAPKHADAAPVKRWANALAWGALGTAVVAGAAAGIPILEKSRKLEEFDRKGMPNNPFPHETLTQVISPKVKATADEGIRSYLYYGDAKGFEAVKSQTDGAYHDFLSYPPIKKALGDGKDITVKFSKTETYLTTDIPARQEPRLEGPAISAKPDNATGPQTAVVLNLSRIWAEATNLKETTDRIKKSDRPLYSMMGAHELRLRMHVASVLKNMRSDFLIDYNNTAYSNIDVRPQNLKDAMAEAIVIDSFKHPVPTIPSDYNDKKLSSSGYDQAEHIRSIFEKIHQDDPFVEGTSPNDPVCVGQPCRYGDGILLLKLSQDIIGKIRQTVYDSAFGEATDDKTQKANKELLAAIPGLYDFVAPSPSPTPSASPTPSSTPSPSNTPLYPSATPSITNGKFDPSTETPVTAPVTTFGTETFEIDPKKPKKPKSKTPGKNRATGTDPSDGTGSSGTKSSGSKSSGSKGSSKSSSRK